MDPSATAVAGPVLPAQGPSNIPDEQAQALTKRLTEEANARNDRPPVVLEVPSPDDFHTMLPGGGYRDIEAHTYYGEAMVSELTGADEEYIDRLKPSNVAAYSKALLKRCVVSIGPFEPPDDNVIGGLLLGDREQLLRQIRIATYGREIEMFARCPVCTAQLDITLDLLDDVPTKVFDSPEERFFTVELRRGRWARLVLPTGADQEDVFAAKGTTAEMNTNLIGKCVLDIDGEQFVGAGSARMLNAADRKTILDALLEHQPGPRYGEVKQPCAACEADLPLVLDLADLFRG